MGIMIVSISPRRRAIVKPLLVRVWIFSSPSPDVSIPSNTTSLSNLHHHAGLPPSSVRARTEVPVKASVFAPGLGSKQPLTSGLGGVNMWIFSSTFLGDMFKRSFNRSVGDRKAAFDWVLELRIKSCLFSSSDLGFDASAAVFDLRFSSAGRHKRCEVESVRFRDDEAEPVRWRDGDDLIEEDCRDEMEGGLERDWLSSLDTTEEGRDLEEISSLSKRNTPESSAFEYTAALSDATDAGRVRSVDVRDTERDFCEGVMLSRAAMFGVTDDQSAGVDSPTSGDCGIRFSWPAVFDSVSSAIADGWAVVLFGPTTSSDTEG